MRYLASRQPQCCLREDSVTYSSQQYSDKNTFSFERECDSERVCEREREGEYARVSEVNKTGPTA